MRPRGPAQGLERSAPTGEGPGLGKRGSKLDGTGGLFLGPSPVPPWAVPPPPTPPSVPGTVSLEHGPHRPPTRSILTTSHDLTASLSRNITATWAGRSFGRDTATT